jgi:hypothetical protein
MMFIAYEDAGAAQKFVFAMQSNSQGAGQCSLQMGALRFAVACGSV